MKKKFLIIGYGSIGQKHVKILKNLNIEYKIISSQKNIKNKIKFNDIEKFNPEFIIIASNTNRHLEDLKKIDKILKNKVILVEKPLSAKNQNFKLINNKNVFIAYNLRFNPLIKYIKTKINNNQLININIKCSSFLPNWRKRHYTLTSSAKKKFGGGVINDLSHEIDFANYFIKNLKVIKIFQKKISNLKIETNDFALIIFGKKKKNCYNKFGIF